MKPALTSFHTRWFACNAVGFTLIELVVSLLLLGILAAMFGLGLTTTLGMYDTSRENVHLAQKAQLAIARITRELTELTDIAARNNTDPFFIIYRNARGTGLHAIARANTQILLYSNLPVGTTVLDAGVADRADVLVDQVSSFNLQYWQAATPWNGTDIRALSAIDATLVLDRRDRPGLTQSFSTRAHMRNTRNYGGASPTLSRPPTASQYCFIGSITAANDKNEPTFFKPDHRPANWIWKVGLMVLLGWMATLRRYAETRPRGKPRGQHGSALIGLIAAVLIFSALGAVLIPLVSSSGQNLVAKTNADKAYLLAESGFRYAASRYLNAGSDIARSNMIDNLNGDTYTLAASQGRFSLAMDSYFYELTADADSTDQIVTRAPGNIAADVTFSGGQKLRIGDTTFTITAAVTNANQVTYTMSTTVTALETGNVALPVADIVNAQTITVNNHENLIYEAGDGNLFPERNGVIRIGNTSLVYSRNDRANHRLEDIHNPDSPATQSALNVSSGDEIVLSRFISVRSTGIYGSGDLLTSRVVTYSVPLPAVEKSAQTFVDTFADTSNWQASAVGTHAIETIAGDSALRVTGTALDFGAPKASLIALSSSSAGTDILRDAYDASGGFLSYDTQVKIGFIATASAPEQGYLPESPFPNYFAAGPSFRLDNDLNSYGVSILRGNLNTDPPFDNIDNDIVPIADHLVIVLWQQFGIPDTSAWLAYKQIDDLTVFEDDMETDSGAWTASGLWHRSTRNPQAGSTTAWYYGQEGTGNYNTGAANGGSLRTAEIELCDYDDYITLSFDSWHATEVERPDDHDIKSVWIRVYKNSAWTNWSQILPAPVSGSSSSGWQTINTDLNLAAYGNATVRADRVQFRFDFDTIDAQFNTYEGWYIDNVRVSGRWPIQNATLAVRVKEGTYLAFDSGDGAAISADDVIIGQTSGARATVLGPPIVASGSWGDTVSPAQGNLILNRVSGTFQTNETLLVIGKGVLARVGVFNAATDAKNNFIKVYYGSQDGCGTPNTNRFDNEKLPNVRNTDPNWPPADEDPWTAADDFFRLIQWDAVNQTAIDNNIAHFSLLSSMAEPQVIIRSSEPELQTPANETFINRPELGLHTFGHGSLNIFFDDFALQSDIPQLNITAPPLQQ